VSLHSCIHLTSLCDVIYQHDVKCLFPKCRCLHGYKDIIILRIVVRIFFKCDKSTPFYSRKRNVCQCIVIYIWRHFVTTYWDMTSNAISPFFPWRGSYIYTSIICICVCVCECELDHPTPILYTLEKLHNKGIPSSLHGMTAHASVTGRCIYTKISGSQLTKVTWQCLLCIVPCVLCIIPGH
jgi:hypothetical protein